MASRVTRRRLSTAAAMYGGTVLGVLATIVAARILGPSSFGLLTLALASAGFLQQLLDTTVEESVVKYGFRYVTAEDWGRLRRLYRIGLGVKWLGGAAAAIAVAILAFLSGVIFGEEELLVPMLIAALIPLVQAPEGIAGAMMMVECRYDLRAWLYAFSMGLRLVGVAVGAGYGVTGAVVGYVLAQVVASVVAAIVGAALLRAHPRASERPLAEDRRGIAGFVLRSGIGTSLVSMRQTLAPLMLGLVSVPAQVGYFRTAQAPMTGFQALSAPVRLVLLTEQTRDVERGESHRVYSTLRRYMVGAVVVVIPAIPVFWALMPWLVDFVFGSAYVPATDAARILLIAASIQLVYGWTKSFPISIGRPGLRIVAHGIEIAVLLPLVLMLGAKWGATGAAAAFLAATAAFAGSWTVILARLDRSLLGVATPRRQATAP